MKNKLKIIIVIIISCFPNMVFSNSFILESENIEILSEKNQINAYKGKAISNDNNLEINSDKFIYLKNLDILKSSGNGKVLIKSKKLIIEYDNAVFDQKKLILKADGNIKIYQIDGLFIIKTNEVLYDQKNNIVSSDNTTKLEDNIGNTYFVDSFKYELNKNLLKVQNLFSKDSKQNTLKTSIAFINTNSGKIFGKDIKIDLNDPSIQNENDYRLRGNSVTMDEDSSDITKGVFTTCKKRDECPPWQFSAKKIKHDKKKREIVYDKATLKLYDVPVAYFPKFFHPDPSVKRRSGFLIPSIKNSSNSNNFLNLPYFHVIADNKDITFSPRLYTDEKFLLQSEYRQKNSQSNHIVDFSFYSEKSGNSKSHFFYEFDKDLETKNFDTFDIKFKIQQTSNDTYLEANKIKSKIINDSNIMENSINLDLYSNDLTVRLNSTVYEDLDKRNNDRYEYILPEISVVKNFGNLDTLNGDFLIESNNLVRQYDTNILERQNINNFIFKSNSKINKFGLLNNYEFLIKNTNSHNENTNYKNKENFYLSGIFQHNSSLPLIAENSTYQKILKPKLTLKAAPNHTKDERNEERKIDITNVYSINRAVEKNTVEGGLSLAYGFDYSLLNKLRNKEILDFKIANNIRLKDNDDLTNSNQIGEKTSNLFNEITYSPYNFFTAKYASSIKNNLKDIDNENLMTEFKFDNFTTTFDYLNENNSLDKNSYISNTTSYSLDKFNSLKFSTRENKTKDLTEYYNFMYQYKNDCLAASIEYNKDFYSDRELQPDESILFKLTITPFAEVTTPNIK